MNRFTFACLFLCFVCGGTPRSAWSKGNAARAAKKKEKRVKKELKRKLRKVEALSRRKTTTHRQLRNSVCALRTLIHRKRFASESCAFSSPHFERTLQQPVAQTGTADGLSLQLEDLPQDLAVLRYKKAVLQAQKEVLALQLELQAMQGRKNSPDKTDRALKHKK